ncbi:MAG: hypothetical protein CMB80_34805 [Flammeovirgaceae bacterium]|nr:hypothetical protein [Flammeovirgaceae bacterium]
MSNETKHRSQEECVVRVIKSLNKCIDDPSIDNAAEMMSRAAELSKHKGKINADSVFSSLNEVTKEDMIFMYVAFLNRKLGALIQ